MRKKIYLRIIPITAFISLTSIVLYDIEHKKKMNMTYLPFRFASRFIGGLFNIELPESIRVPVYKLWAYLFSSNLNEISNPLYTYKSMSDFFSRKININKYRPFKESSDIISPVDGKVFKIGELNNNLINAKGTNFTFYEFTGDKLIDKLENKDSVVKYISLYLAPGDYHRIHSPMNWNVYTRRHFSGSLLPISPFFSSFFPSIFTVNERIVLSGKWKYGYCSLVPIGALNVGSIQLSPLIEPNLKTNNSKNDYKIIKGKLKNYIEFKNYKSENEGIEQKKMDEIGLFRFGSTVVILFEIPRNRKFIFNKKEGDLIKVGEEIECLSLMLLKNRLLDSLLL